MRFRALIPALLVICGLASQASAGHVQTELLANVSAIQPSKPFWLGVRLTVDPTWHVYWKNPGDAGLPTRVKFTLPEGFTAGALQFPTPQRFEQPGGIVAFGYENSVMLLTQITPPANLPADFQQNFHAAVSWLVCSNVCVPGKANVDLTLGASVSPSPANRELFDEWSSQVPVDSAADSEIASVSVAAKDVVTVTWRHEAPDHVDFFPASLDDYNVAGTTEKTGPGTTAIHFTATPLTGKSPGSMVLEAVLGYSNKDGKRRGVILSIDLPAQAGNNR